MSTARPVKLSLPVSGQTTINHPPFDPFTEKAAVLIFTATWCRPCSTLTPYYSLYKTQYPDLPIMSMSNEPATKLQHYYAKVLDQLKHTVVSVSADTWETIGSEFQVNGIPFAAVFIDSEPIFTGHPAQPEFAQALAKANQAIQDAKAPATE
jgi:thioredoxin-like negative regulator of GroEL